MRFSFGLLSRGSRVRVAAGALVSSAFSQLHTHSVRTVRDVFRGERLPLVTLAAILPPKDTTPSFWSTWHPQISQGTIASAALLVAFACAFTLVAGTGWNIWDGWKRPSYRYGLAFAWSLLAAFLILLCIIALF